MWFDSHCHLDSPAFDDDRTQVLDDALDVGVTRLLLPGTSPRSWRRSLDTARLHQGLVVALGIHPHATGELALSEVTEGLRVLPDLAEREGVVAIGECGLDGLHAKRGGASLERQEEIFEQHLRLASALSLPVVVHVVRAHERALGLLGRVPPVRGVVHAYSGPAELVTDYVRLGFSFGFGGAITRERALRPLRALERVPLDRLLLETDAPDQAPEGFPSRNEPRSLLDVARVVARRRDLSLTELARVTTANALALFPTEPRAGLLL